MKMTFKEDVFKELVNEDLFLQFMITKYKNSETLFNSLVIGDSIMENRYLKIYNNHLDIKVEKSIINKKYEHSINVFAQIIPSELFDRFTYQELNSFEDADTSDCEKGKILFINNEYYLFMKTAQVFLNVKRKNLIRFQKNGNLIKEVYY